MGYDFRASSRRNISRRQYASTYYYIFGINIILTLSNSKLTYIEVAVSNALINYLWIISRL
jgi:hypothetical protein